MNGDTPVQDGGNTVPLREYIERILQERSEAVLARQTDLERRLEGLNELRSDVVKDRAQFVRQETYNAASEQRDSRITALEREQAARTELIGQFRAVQADIQTIRKEINEIKQDTASAEAVNSFKRILYTFAATAVLAFAIAAFNLATKAGT